MVGKRAPLDPRVRTREAARTWIGHDPLLPEIQVQCAMRFLHAMLRVVDVDATLAFFALLGLHELRRREVPAGRFTLYFLATEDGAPEIELTHNWDESAPYTQGRNFGHLAYEVDDIYGLCERLHSAGVAIARPPRDGRMAFVRSPDGISIELLQRGEALPVAEPWASAPNHGSW